MSATPGNIVERALKPPLVRAVPRNPLELLHDSGRRRSYRRNEVVFHEGDEGTTLYLATKGRFAMEMRSEEGQVLLLAVLLPEDIFGDISILSSDSHRAATVVALEPAEAMVVERAEFNRLWAQFPEFDELVCSVLARRLREAVQRIAELAHVPAPRRVLRVLARLTEMYANGDGPTIVSFSQQRLAAMAGTSRDTVNRVLARGERAGWLDVRREKIVVLNVDELKRRAR